MNRRRRTFWLYVDGGLGIGLEYSHAVGCERDAWTIEELGFDIDLPFEGSGLRRGCGWGVEGLGP